MTNQLKEAIERIKTLPEDQQNDVGSVLLSVIDPGQSEMRLTEAQESEVRHRLSRQGGIATEEETEEAFRSMIG